MVPQSGEASTDGRALDQLHLGPVPFIALDLVARVDVSVADTPFDLSILIGAKAKTAKRLEVA